MEKLWVIIKYRIVELHSLVTFRVSSISVTFDDADANIWEK